VIDLRGEFQYTLHADASTITITFETADRHTPLFIEQTTGSVVPRVINADGKAVGSGNPPQVPVDAPPPWGNPVIPSPPIPGGALPSTGQAVNPGSALLKPAMDSAVPSDAPVPIDIVENTSRVAAAPRAPPMNPSTPIASTPAAVESADRTRVEGAAQGASTSVGNVGAPARDGDYVIGPEDVLAINVWHEAELSRLVPVRPDGKISLPLVGDLKASGLTPRELEAELTKGLDAYIHKPQVTVIIQEVNSHKFYVLGGVQRPGSYPLSPNITVLGALVIAGGFRDFAKVNQIYLLRLWPDGTRSHIRFDYKAAVHGSNSYRDLELKAGDTVVVP
jgi:polysaccharide export outer membrane protein